MTTNSIKPKSQKSQIPKHPEVKTPKPGDKLVFRCDFFQVPHKIFDLTFTPYQISILLYLLRCAQFKDGQIFPSYKTIARNCHISERTAIRSIKELCKLGIVNCIYRAGKTNLFEISLKGVTVRHTRGDRESPPPVTESHPSNKEFSNKELYFTDQKNKPIKSNQELCRHYWVRIEEGEYICLTCGLSREIEKAKEPQPLRKIEDGHPDLIPLDSLNKGPRKLSSGDVLGNIKRDIEAKQKERAKKK